MFIHKRGDPSHQLTLLNDSTRSLMGASLMLLICQIGIFSAVRVNQRKALLGRLSGILTIYAASQVVSVGWRKMMGSGDTDFLNSLIHTVFYSVGTISIQVSLGLIIAFALYRKLRGFTIFRFLIFLPYVVPVVAMATVFRLIFGARESSLSNQMLTAFGGEPLKWIVDSTPLVSRLLGIEIDGLIAGPSLGMITVILFGVFSYTGYNAVILLAGLTSIPAELYEAAEIEGASAWQTGNRNIGVTGSPSVSSGNYLNWVDGDTTASASKAWYWDDNGTVDSNRWIKLDFDGVDGGSGATRVITEFRYHSNGYDNSTNPDSGTFKWQGSNDDTNWTDIGSNWAMATNLGWNTFSNTINNNTTAYRYYKIVGVSGTSHNPWMTEIEFKVQTQAAVAGKAPRLHGWAVNY